MQPELLYFRWSHYNEKARWALEYKGVPHVRRTLLPGKHREAAQRLTGQTALPILILHGNAIKDSTRIIEALEHAYPNPPLYPRDPGLRHRALELEEFFDEELGPHVRRVVFAACYPHSVYMAHLFDADEKSFASRWLYRAMLHSLKSRLAGRLKIDPASIENSWHKITGALDRLEQEIQPNGYLAGDSFSVADLTAAAMLSVVALPPEFPCCPSRSLPQSVQDVMQRFVSRHAWQWTHDIYQRHRAASAPMPIQASPGLDTRQKAAA
jgi:glutathione S-transferase